MRRVRFEKAVETWLRSWPTPSPKLSTRINEELEGLASKCKDSNLPLLCALDRLARYGLQFPITLTLPGLVARGYLSSPREVYQQQMQQLRSALTNIETEQEVDWDLKTFGERIVEGIQELLANLYADISPRQLETGTIETLQIKDASEDKLIYLTDAEIVLAGGATVKFDAIPIPRDQVLTCIFGEWEAK